MSQRLVLASSSPFRKALLDGAGLSFETRTAEIDERSVETPLVKSGVGPQDVALVLAEAKALDASARHPQALIIGADQTLSLGDELLHKPPDMDAARNHLLKLSGRTHQLNSAVVLARDNETIWRHVETADMTMRDLDPGFIGRYLSRVGDKALQSVGAYQLEGEGVQLFKTIKGDYFTIIGLPLLPLLAELRRLEVIDG
jgi:septum formation protein